MRSIINEITNEKSLNYLVVDPFVVESITQEELTYLGKVAKAVWVHNGNTSAPHAVMTSGLCSNGYINLRKLLKYPNICQIAAQALVSMFDTDKFEYPDWVIGSDHTAATLSFCAAWQMGTKHDFTEKGPNKTQLWQAHEILPEETVLLVEDLITTSSTLKEVKKGIQASSEHKVKFLPQVLALVNRSGEKTFDGAKISSVARYKIDVWPQEICPLCAGGSKRILHPRKNWRELTET